MNPYTYKNFITDMIEATSEFIEGTNYEIESITNCSVSLTNKIKRISFYLEGASMVSTIEQINGFNKKALYELFLENGIFNKYPIDKENIYKYEEWNKVVVNRQLEVLKTNLAKYL